VSGQGPRDSNERLEFLGDSVLGLVTSEYLYRAHPTEHEGQLTKTKSLLVSKAILSRRALAMGLGKFVLMSHSEVESGGRQRLSILADAFEAVVGAVYLDQGFEAAREFIERWLLRESRVIAADKRHTNYKSHLQEYVQGAFRTHPVYRIRSEMGPDHSKQFNVEVMVGKRVLGQGKGRNKKEAEQSAARDALERVEVAHAERARRREVREGRPGREDEAVAGPRHGRAVPAADQPMEEPSGVDETESEEGSAGRRRRGRRGGRGRRRPEGHDLETTASAGPATRPAPAPFMRPAPESPVERRERVTELEPLPPARHEDDLEEVGRPEGPLEERHVDPYAWTSPLESDARPDEEEAAAWPEPVSEDMDSESSAAETSDEPADSQEETRDESPSFRSAESDEEPTPERDDRGSSASQETREEEPVEGPTEGESGRGEPKQPPAPTWGRRVRRGPGR
jgi:ribonuclease-3